MAAERGARLPGRIAGQRPHARAGWLASLGGLGPVLLVAPAILLPAIYVIVYTAWTAIISFSASTLVLDYSWVGLEHYRALFASRLWVASYVNLVIYGAGFIGVALAVGLLLAVLIDQHIRGENLFRSIYLYPMAVSFVVTGTVWAWILNPGIGLEQLVRGLGWETFRFQWLVDREMAIYTVIIAAVWQASGFAMVLLLAGLRSVNPELFSAAQIDGAGVRRTYCRVIFPEIWPMILTVAVILLQFAIKTYDLVIALTAGGPGNATVLPTVVVYDYIFERGVMGRGSAAAVMLLLSLALVLLPYQIIRRMRRTGAGV